MNQKLKKLTLIMIVKQAERQVLLGMKKRGFGEGWWNGFGGKVQEGESIAECAKRETQEECGLVMEEYYQIGHMLFEFVGDPVLLDVTVFRCDNYSGTVTESEEMRPKWFSFDDVPFDKMWPDDKLWYPLLFKNQKFKADYLFEGHHKILRENIVHVDQFN
eukprot:TCONS_00064292-protein